MPRPPGQHRKVLERTWMGRGSYARGALARRGERLSASHGTPGAGGYERDLEGHPPRRGVLSLPGPARGSPRVDETFPETGE